MWPACEISVPRCIVDINQVGGGGSDGGARRRLVYISANSPRARARAIDATRRYRGAGGESGLLRTFPREGSGRGGHGLEGRGRVGSNEQRTTRSGEAKMAGADGAKIGPLFAF